MNNTTETREALKGIVSRSGEQILQDTDRCEGLLKDHCAGHRREIAALVGALEERVPLELKSSWQSAMTPEAMRSRLVQRLQDNRGLAPDVANWAVDTWSYALGVGLGRRSDPVVLPELEPAVIVNPEVAREFASQHQQQIEPPTPTPAPAGQWSSEKKAVAAVAACVALYFGYQNGLFPHPTPTPAQTCLEGQTKAADGGCVVAKVQPKDQPKGQDHPQPKAKTNTGLVAGTAIPVTVSETLNSDTVTVGQYVKGTVNAPVVLDGKTVVPAGTKVILQVKGVDQSGKVLGSAKIDLALVEMTIGGKKHTITSAQAVVAGPSQTAHTAKDAGILGAIGTGVGCGVGRLFKHTGAGCAAGAVGGAGTGVVVASNSKPKPAVLEPGKVVRFKLGQPINLA